MFVWVQQPKYQVKTVLCQTAPRVKHLHKIYYQHSVLGPVFILNLRHVCIIKLLEKNEITSLYKLQLHALSTVKNMSLDYSFEIVNHNSAPIILTSKATVVSIYV